MSDSVRPHRRQPTRLPRSWDSPGENTGVGCHFLLQCMKVKGEIEVSRSCPTLSDPMDRSPPGSSVHAIFQARALERVAIASPLTVCRTLQNLTPTSQRPRPPSSSSFVAFNAASHLRSFAHAFPLQWSSHRLLPDRFLLIF